MESIEENKKIIIPYILWTLVYVTITNYKNLSSIPLAYIKGLILANSSAVMYYVFVYCQFAVLIPVIEKLARSKYYYLGFLVAPIEIVIMRYLPLYMGFTFNEYINCIKCVSCLGWFSYFYIGYLIGNQIIKVNIKTKKLILFWFLSIGLQIGEGYLQYLMGETNCGAQLKLTSVLSGVLFSIISYKFINSNIIIARFKFLKILGDNSLGIFFSHMAVMTVLEHIPYYRIFVVYPFNAIISILATLLCVEIGKKFLGKYSKYIAL